MESDLTWKLQVTVMAEAQVPVMVVWVLGMEVQVLGTVAELAPAVAMDLRLRHM